MIKVPGDEVRVDFRITGVAELAGTCLVRFLGVHPMSVLME